MSSSHERGVIEPVAVHAASYQTARRPGSSRRHHAAPPPELTPPRARGQAGSLGVEGLLELDADGGGVRDAASGAAAAAGALGDGGCLAHGVTAHGVPVSWFQHFTSAVAAGQPPDPPSSAPSPDDDDSGGGGGGAESAQVGGGGEEEEEEEEEPPLLLVLANEFFDALPARQFVRTDEHGWCEVCVDIDDDPLSDQTLRFALAPQTSAAADAYVPFLLQGERQRRAEAAAAATEHEEERLAVRA
jgi:hypothetical protein